jgi:uncharacterized spore protein YtfJ
MDDGGREAEDILHGVMDRESIPNQILDRIKQSARVELAYGESRVVGDKTIIPVALVAYLFGGGSGSGVGQGHNGQSEGVGIGGGGGGSVRVQPVAVVEVTEEETRLVPVIDWTRIITAGITAFGVWMVVRQLFRKR